MDADTIGDACVGSKPEEKAPAAKAEDKLAAPFSFFGGALRGDKTISWQHSF